MNGIEKYLFAIFTLLVLYMAIRLVFGNNRYEKKNQKADEC